MRYGPCSPSPEPADTPLSHARGREPRAVYPQHPRWGRPTIENNLPESILELFAIEWAEHGVDPDVPDVRKNGPSSVTADGPNGSIVTSNDLMGGGQDGTRSDSDSEIGPTDDHGAPIFRDQGHARRRSDIPPLPWQASTPVPDDSYAPTGSRPHRVSGSSCESPTSSRSPRGTFVASPDLSGLVAPHSMQSPAVVKTELGTEDETVRNKIGGTRVQSAPMLPVIHPIAGTRVSQASHHRRRSFSPQSGVSPLAPRSLYVGAGMAVLGTSANRRFDDGFYIGDPSTMTGPQHLQRPFARSYSVDTGTSEFSRDGGKSRQFSDSDPTASIASRGGYAQTPASGALAGDLKDGYSGDSYGPGPSFDPALRGDGNESDDPNRALSYPVDEQDLSDRIAARRPSGPAQHPGPIGGGGILGPAPVRRKSAVKVDVDEFGIPWIEFEYTRDRVKWLYRCRTDVFEVDLPNLTTSFKSSNCVYPGAMVPSEEYTGHRQNYEKQCNELGWRLSWLNPVLRQRRGLIQRAVDSYRNTSSDPSVRSRRARRLARGQAASNKSD